MQLISASLRLCSLRSSTARGASAHSCKPANRPSPAPGSLEPRGAAQKLPCRGKHLILWDVTNDKVTTAMLTQGREADTVLQRSKAGEAGGSMAIGEFGGVPAVAVATGPMYAAPAYWLYEMSQAALNPARAWADAARLFFKNPANPLSYTVYGRTLSAGMELFERSTRRYGKPDWNISSTVIGGEHVPVRTSAVWARPFCRVLHFERIFERAPRRPQPRLL